MIGDNTTNAADIPIPETVPLDQHRLAVLVEKFAELSVAKQNWLLTRFPHCETDKEATKLSPDVTDSQVDHWKREDPNFSACYHILKGGLVDWEQHLARSIDVGNALLGAVEFRKLLMVPWGESARSDSAKASAINQILDRALGKSDKVDVRVIRVEDILPDRRGVIPDAKK